MVRARWAFLLLGCLGILSLPVSAAPRIYLGAKASIIERTAASELQRYLAAGGKAAPQTDTRDELPKDASGYVVGTPDSLPKTGSAWPFGLEEPQGDGYLIHTIADGGRRLVVVSARTPFGVQCGVYGLLEELGFGFYLGGDAVPAAVPGFDEVVARNLHVSVTPVFSVRGSLPWYNFFDSPTTWEPQDHKSFVDQMVKMRCNFVGFHTYDNEPFAAFDYNGRLIGGEPLVNTSKPTWGTQPLATTNFLDGTGDYFDRDFFGAASSFIPDRAQSIKAAKKVLHDSLAYAKTRGMKVCLGFEVSGNPGDPEVQKQFEARLKALLADYPMLDYVWLWESEAQAVSPMIQPAPRSLFQSYVDRWGPTFDSIPEEERRAEAVRLSMFALHGYQVIKALRPDIGLVMSGWGGDQWLHCTDFYPGMDKLLPKDITFSALDNIRVTPTVSKAYGSLPADRPKWPIIWFEYDGDQWGPQPNLRATASACRDALAKGSQGLLGIHWRTRGVEESATYCARFAWNPGLTVEGFCKRRAADLYGPQCADKMSDILVRLQTLGYRWVGGDGQTECGPFAWNSGDPSKHATLGALLDEVQGMATQPPGSKKVRDRSRAGSTALDDLASYMSYQLSYDEAAAAFVPGGEFDRLLGEEKPEETVRFIKTSPLNRALHQFARQIKDKGDLGVLATINTKAWADIRKRSGLSDELLATLERGGAGEQERSPSVLVLADRVIVCGVSDKHLEVVLRVRRLGERWFTKIPLTRMGGSSFALEFPKALAGGGPVEYLIEARAKGLRLTWPAESPGRPAMANLIASAAPSVPGLQSTEMPAAPSPVGKLVAERMSVQLTWTARHGETYTVSRGGKTLGVVSDGWFEDTALPPVGAATYSVQARNVASNRTESAEVSVDIPALPLPSPPAEVQAVARADRIILGWQSDAPNAAQYYVVKRDKNRKIIEESYVDADYGHYIQIADQVDPGREYTYTVAGVTPDKRVGEPSKKIGITSTTDPLKPVLNLSFEDNSFLEGVAKLADKSLALGGKGWAKLAPQEEWNPKHSLSVSLWVKFDSLEGMPVLVCKGAWNQSGYFLQLLNKQLRFYLAGVDVLDSGRPSVGRWQHIVATYGQNEMRIYMDGELAGRKHVMGRPRASQAPLLIGRYGTNDDAYFVHGVLDDIRIYDVPLTENEVRTLFRETRRQ